MSRFLVLAAALLAITSAVPTCEETPPTWTGFLYEISFEDLKLSLKISQANYDRTAKKIKITDVDVNPGDKAITLMDYSAGMEYVSVNGDCKKSSLTGDIPSFGVPEGGTLEPNGAKYLGSSLPNLGVLVYEFEGTDNTIGAYYLTYAPVADGTACVPLIRSTLTASPLKEALIEYTNITTTLPSDPFSMPPGC